MSQSTHCHVWNTDGQYQGTRRLTMQDRRMLTAQGWKMTLVQRPAPDPRTWPQRWQKDGPPTLAVGRAGRRKNLVADAVSSPPHRDPNPPDEAA